MVCGGTCNPVLLCPGARSTRWFSLVCSDAVKNPVHRNVHGVGAVVALGTGVGTSGVAGAVVPLGGALTIPDGEVSAVWALPRVAASIHALVTKHATTMRVASRKRATLHKGVDDSASGFCREFQDKCAPS